MCKNSGGDKGVFDQVEGCFLWLSLGQMLYFKRWRSGPLIPAKWRMNLPRWMAIPRNLCNFGISVGSGNWVMAVIFWGLFVSQFHQWCGRGTLCIYFVVECNASFLEAVQGSPDTFVVLFLVNTMNKNIICLADDPCETLQNLRHSALKYFMGWTSINQKGDDWNNTDQRVWQVW